MCSGNSMDRDQSSALPPMTSLPLLMENTALLPLRCSSSVWGLAQLQRCSWFNSVCIAFFTDTASLCMFMKGQYSILMRITSEEFTFLCPQTPATYAVGNWILLDGLRYKLLETDYRPARWSTWINPPPFQFPLGNIHFSPYCFSQTLEITMDSI